MKRIIPLLRRLMKPAMAICLTCLLAGPLLADEGAGEMKLQKARAALTGESKDTVQAKKLLLDIVEHDKDTLDSKSLCYVYVYLGYIEDRAGNRKEAIPWYRKALEIKGADRVQECATYGMEKPLVWIRHLDEGAGEMKLQKARAALTGESKDPVQAKKLLLDIVEHDKDTLDSKSLCYVYVYLGYIEDRAGNRNEAIPWYQKALEIKDADRVRECATYGMEKPLVWIRHLDEGTGEISLQSAPPVVVKTVPVAGATEVDPALTEIRVTYSKPMQDGSWSWCSWSEENYPQTTGKPQYLSDSRTCVLPVKLKPDKFYAIWLNSEKFKNFRDASGKPAVPYLLTFSTKRQAGQVSALSGNRTPDASFTSLLNDDQQAVLAWTDRQFHSFFDDRSFDGWSDKERAKLEARLLDSLQDPQSQEYYQAINTLAALRSVKALTALRKIAFDRAEKDNRDRWMATRALGIIGDKASVPEMIHLLYHYNSNTRWWAQTSLVRLTGTNFAKDWNVWGKWWNDQNGQPPFQPEIIRWWSQQPEPGKLAESLNESDSEWLNGIRNQVQTGEQYLQQQLKLANAGNYWAKFSLWEAFAQGTHEVNKNPAEAGKWLSELVKGAYLAKFEPVNGFNPRTPKEMLDEFDGHCQLHSGRDSLGGASFFRTTKQGDKLIGSFLTELPDEFKTAIGKNPNLKLISIEKVTPEMFLAHEASAQESF